MTDFTATRPFSYVAGTTIDPDENNPNENTIYNNFNASMHAITGHTHSGSTGDGPKIGSSGIDLTANYDFTGSLEFSKSSTQTSVIAATNAAAFIIQNTNTTVNNYQSLDFKNDTGAIVGRIASVNLDHTAASEDTKLEFVLITAGTRSSPFAIQGSDIAVSSGGKIRLNTNFSGGTYIYESSANIVSFWAGGNEQLGINGVSNFAYIPATRKFYLDGGGDTYINESSSNIINMTAGGTDMIRLDKSGATPAVLVQSGVDFSVQPTRKIHLDGAGDTYFIESSDNNIDCYTGGSLAFTVTSGQDITISGSNRIQFRDSDTSIYELLNAMAFNVDGSTIANFNNLGLGISGHISTDINHADPWTLGAYTGGAPAATGYVSITVSGVSYKLLAST